MDEIREQMNMSNDISDAIARPAFGNEIDEDELKEELEALEQEELDNKLIGVDVPSQRVPTTHGTPPRACTKCRTRAETKVQGGRGRGSRVARFTGRDGNLIGCVGGIQLIVVARFHCRGSLAWFGLRCWVIVGVYLVVWCHEVERR
jgi:hypothetical protein